MMPLNDAGVAAPPSGDLARSLAARLTVERSAVDEKAYAEALLDLLRADRLLWPEVPSGPRARRLTVLEAARATAAVARLSGSAGLIYAMHLSQAYSLARHAAGSPHLRELWARLVRDQALVASGTSEKGVGGDIYGSRCTVEPQPGGGLVVAKESPNISYLDLAGAVLITAMQARPDSRSVQVLIAVERQDLEARAGASAGFIGMRGILNRPYSLTARASETAIFPEAYPVIAGETMTPIVHIMWAALWSGLARRALDAVRAFQRKSGDPKDPVVAATRAELSRLIDKHYTMNALIRDAIADYEQTARGDGFGLRRTTRIKRLKIVSSELLEQICSGSLSLIGLPAYAEAGPFSLSELLRDAMSARVMISNFRLREANAHVERFVEEEL